MTDNALNHAGAHSRLTELVASGITQARELVAILDSEQQAVVTHDGDALLALTVDKQARIARLNELDILLRETLARAGISVNRAGVTKFLMHDDTSGRNAENWRLLTRLLRHARRQNRINGAALGSQRHNVEHTLRRLRGGAPAAQYSRAGVAPGFDAQRSLGRV